MSSETEIISAGFAIKPLGDIVEFLDGQRRPVKDSDRAKMKGQYPYYGASGIVDYVNEYLFDEDLILLGEDGENILSRNCRLAFKVSGKIWVNNHAHVLRPNRNIHIDFLSEYLESLDYAQYNTGTAQPKLNKKVCSSIPVLLPDYKEQTAIAAALSDTDALISSLDKLIAKKRDIKQAAMQELLTGKMRLPGFEGEWFNLNIANDSTLKARIGWQGLTTAEYKEDGDYYLVTGTDFLKGKIDWKNCFFVEKERYRQDKNIQLKIGDILLTKDGTIGKVGYIDLLLKPATLNSGVFVIRPKNERYNSRFLYFILNSCIFNEFLAKLQAGSTISHLYQKDFATFNFLAPCIEEQTAIATILSAMDSEITELEHKRNKLRMIKEGMMQELLTGRIRLPVTIGGE